MTREHIHPRATAKKIQHHLRGDLPGVGAHAFCCHAMVGHKGKHDPARHIRFDLTRNCGITHGGFFQPAKTPQGFDQPVKASLGLPPLFHDHRLNTPSTSSSFIEFLPFHLSLSDWPLMTT